MGKQVWKAGNMVYPVPAAMISMADKDGNQNIITVSWTGTICTNPAMVYISVKPERHSYKILEETKEFVINLTTEYLARATDFCGVKSGRDIDKFKLTKLTAEEAKFVKAPLIKESPVNIECKVKEIVPLGSHSMFVAEVLAIHADEAYIDSKGKFDLSKAKPIAYSHGEYYALGKKVGSFGYSVKKKKR